MENCCQGLWWLPGPSCQHQEVLPKGQSTVWSGSCSAPAKFQTSIRMKHGSLATAEYRAACKAPAQSAAGHQQGYSASRYYNGMDIWPPPTGSAISLFASNKFTCRFRLSAEQFHQVGTREVWHLLCACNLAVLMQCSAQLNYLINQGFAGRPQMVKALAIWNDAICAVCLQCFSDCSKGWLDLSQGSVKILHCDLHQGPCHFGMQGTAQLTNPWGMSHAC